MELENKSNYTFKCSYCEKSFTKQDYRNRHVKLVHKKSNKGNDLTNTSFSCILCDKNYEYKSNLKRHVMTVHSSTEFNCNHCNFVTNRKSTLQRHIFRIHENKSARNKDDINRFKCTYCATTFKTKVTLKVHEKNKHDIKRGVPRQVNIKCPLCSFSSNSYKKKEMYNHFKKTHNLILKQEKYSFQNIKEFNEWMRNIEIKNKSSYIKKNPISNITYYYCHRRGNFKSQGQNKRSDRIIGSCKINGYCPSEIKATFNEDGTVSVIFVPDHVGHKNELKFMRLKPEEKKIVTDLIQAKMSREEILNNLRSSLTNQEFKRIHLINRKDIINIEKRFNEKSDIKKHPFDPVSVEGWIKELQSRPDTAMLAYKPIGGHNADFAELKPEDFLFVYMTVKQKSMLQNFGKYTVCVDRMHDVNNHNIHLYFLMIVDECREAFPCAFMFTNTADVSIIYLFFKHIRDAVGIITTNVFMSDMEETFYSAWCKHMGPAQMWLFSTKHMLKAWRSSLNKLKNKYRKEEVYEILKTVMYELEKETFHKLLETVLQNFSNDEDIKDYMQYFKGNFIENKMYKHWAYAYRMHAGINTNISFENFNKVLKYCYSKGENIYHLNQSLCAVLNLIKDELFDYVVKIEKDNLTSKLQTLKNRHKTSLVIKTANILEDGFNKWQVLPTKGSELYTVKKVQNCNNCNLLCLNCHSCFHEFICTCTDSFVKNNMCQHIHAVALNIPYEATTPVEDFEEVAIVIDILPENDQIKTETDKMSMSDIKQKEHIKIISNFPSNVCTENEQIEVEENVSHLEQEETEIQDINNLEPIVFVKTDEVLDTENVHFEYSMPENKHIKLMKDFPSNIGTEIEQIEVETILTEENESDQEQEDLDNLPPIEFIKAEQIETEIILAEDCEFFEEELEEDIQDIKTTIDLPEHEQIEIETIPVEASQFGEEQKEKEDLQIMRDICKEIVLSAKSKAHKKFVKKVLKETLSTIQAFDSTSDHTDKSSD